MGTDSVITRGIPAYGNMSFKDEWRADKKYQFNNSSYDVCDVVIYNGSQYVTIAEPAIGDSPATATTKWRLIGTVGSTPPTTQYKVSVPVQNLGQTLGTYTQYWTSGSLVPYVPYALAPYASASSGMTPTYYLSFSSSLQFTVDLAFSVINTSYSSGGDVLTDLNIAGVILYVQKTDGTVLRKPLSTIGNNPYTTTGLSSLKINDVVMKGNIQVTSTGADIEYVMLNLQQFVRTNSNYNMGLIGSFAAYINITAITLDNGATYTPIAEALASGKAVDMGRECGGIMPRTEAVLKGLIA